MRSPLAASGIARKRPCLYRDIFAGAADAIINAGLARRDELPGAFGRGKTACSYLPDGSSAYHTGRAGHWKREGFRRITKLGNGRFEVAVTVAPAEVERRRDAEQSRWDAQDRRGVTGPDASHLTLVWSRP